MPEVIVTDYDAGWPGLYEEEAARIRAALGDVIAGIEHMGSTAVPGLAGKPVIDISVGLFSLDLDAAQIHSLEALGYTYLGEYGLPGRLYFSKPTHHVHAVAWDGQHWHRHRAFRDYLTAHPQEARAYAAVKRRIALVAASSEDYWERKQAFVDALFERAWAWYRRVI